MCIVYVSIWPSCLIRPLKYTTLVMERGGNISKLLDSSKTHKAESFLLLLNTKHCCMASIFLQPESLMMLKKWPKNLILCWRRQPYLGLKLNLVVWQKALRYLNISLTPDVPPPIVSWRWPFVRCQAQKVHWLLHVCGTKTSHCWLPQPSWCQEPPVHCWESGWRLYPEGDCTS